MSCSNLLIALQLGAKIHELYAIFLPTEPVRSSETMLLHLNCNYAYYMSTNLTGVYNNHKFHRQIILLTCHYKSLNQKTVQ